MGEGKGWGLLHFHQLNFEDQGGIWRDYSAGAGRAVSQLRRDEQFACAADLHASDALIPALDHRAVAQGELEWLAAVA